jgi:8-oxo-dGTP pyrophosphatase MutT (NUDIX family)
MPKHKPVKRKILAFVTDGESFLLLRNNFFDNRYGGDFWFTVTGEVEGGEDDLSAVRREIMEETSLDVKEIFPLNWGSIYTQDDIVCEEYNYLAFTNQGNIQLNEEHIEYKWVGLETFAAQIHWTTDRFELKKVLDKGLKRELYFKESSN